MPKQTHEARKQVMARTEDEPELMDEQIAKGYISQETTEESTAKWLRDRNNPTMGRAYYREGGQVKSEGFMQLSKDLRLGNLPKNQVRMFDPGLLMEMTDVSRQCERIGADKFASFLVMLRDSAINLSASSGGFEIIQQNSSNVNINKAMTEQKPQGFQIFPRKKNEAQ